MDKVLRVLTSEEFPPLDERVEYVVYFVYDKMELFLGRNHYTDPFCIVEDVPPHPVEGMLYITLDGRLKTYIDFEVVDIGGVETLPEIDLLREAGTIYFMKAEYRYLDLQTRCIALPFQNGTYQLSVNLAANLKIDKDTVIIYNEETGHFEIDGNYAGHGYTGNPVLIGSETETVRTEIDGSTILPHVKLSKDPDNMISVRGSGLYARITDAATEEDIEYLTRLYNNYTTQLNGMIAQVEEEMEEKGYNTTEEIIAQKIHDALVAYKPTIDDMFANYDVIYQQLGYIRDASYAYTDERVSAVRAEIINYLDGITNAWNEFDYKGQSIDEQTLSPEETAYLADKVQEAYNHIKLTREEIPISGENHDLDYIFIGGLEDLPVDIPLLPKSITVVSEPGAEMGKSRVVVTSGDKEEGDYYYYKQTSAIPGWKTDVVSLGYLRWNGEDEIELTNGEDTIFVETNHDKQAIKYCRFKAASRTEDLEQMEILNIQQTGGSTETSVSLIVSPAKEAGNKYYYREAETVPVYNTLVESDYIPWDGVSDINMSGYDQKLVALVECTSNPDRVVKFGTFVVNLQGELLKKLNVRANGGSVDHAISLTVLPSKAQGNEYYYSFGAVLPVLNTYLPSTPGWVLWDGTSDIETDEYTGSTVVAETRDGKVKKAGSAAFVACNELTPDLHYNEDMYLYDYIVSDASKVFYKVIDYTTDRLNYGDDVPADYREASYNISVSGYDIQFELNHRLAIATVDSNDKVVQFCVTDPVIEEAGDITFDTSFDSTENKLTLSNVTAAGLYDRILYQLLISEDSKVYVLNEPIDASLYDEYDSATPIDVNSEDFTMVRLVAIDSVDRVLSEGKQTFRSGT